MYLGGFFPDMIITGITLLFPKQILTYQMTGILSVPGTVSVLFGHDTKDVVSNRRLLQKSAPGSVAELVFCLPLSCSKSASTRLKKSQQGSLVA